MNGKGSPSPTAVASGQGLARRLRLPGQLEDQEEAVRGRNGAQGGANGTRRAPLGSGKVEGAGNGRYGPNSGLSPVWAASPPSPNNLRPAGVSAEDSRNRAGFLYTAVSKRPVLCLITSFLSSLTRKQERSGRPGRTGPKPLPKKSCRRVGAGRKKGVDGRSQRRNVRGKSPGTSRHDRATVSGWNPAQKGGSAIP